MRVVTRDEFMGLPEGTIFQKGRPWVFGGLSVKGETILHGGKAIDWFYIPTDSIDASDSGELFARYDSMLRDGASYPLDLECQSRDGCFDNGDIFMIYEASDVLSLAGLLTGLSSGAGKIS